MRWYRALRSPSAPAPAAPVRLPATPLTVLTPVTPGEEQDLIAHLARLPTGADSPFERLGTAHFARWVVVGGIPAGYPGAPFPEVPLRNHYLLFTSTVTTSVADHLEQLRVVMGLEADGVWGHCVGYPGHHAAAAFHRYLRHNTLPSHMWFHAYDATAAEVRSALQLREQHLTFARAAQELATPAELQRAFLDHFGGTG